MDNTREKLIELLWEYDQMRIMRMSIEECADRLIPKGLTVRKCENDTKCIEFEVGGTKNEWEMREKLIELLKNGGVRDFPFNAALADHLIANGVTVQKWIPVTERLPRQILHVLVYTPKVSEFGAKTVGEAWIGVDGCWHSPTQLVDGDKVTHWIPLPEPPKGASNEQDY